MYRTELLFHFFPLLSLFFRFFLISRITGAGGERGSSTRKRRGEEEGLEEEERGKFGKERRVRLEVEDNKGRMCKSLALFNRGIICSRSPPGGG